MYEFLTAHQPIIIIFLILISLGIAAAAFIRPILRDKAKKEMDRELVDDLCKNMEERSNMQMPRMPWE